MKVQNIKQLQIINLFINTFYICCKYGVWESGFLNDGVKLLYDENYKLTMKLKYNNGSLVKIMELNNV